jgi:F0F1-type ATP synthase membrane subunit c/vacuolar-type H+-ATPase subunit K
MQNSTLFVAGVAVCLGGAGNGFTTSMVAVRT